MRGVAAIGIFPDPALGDEIRAGAAQDGQTYPKPEGDIAIDNAYHAFLGTVDVGTDGFTILLHEIGHALW